MGNIKSTTNTHNDNTHCLEIDLYMIRFRVKR